MQVKEPITIAMQEVEFFGKKISPIIECSIVEFETGVMIRRALRWMDSNERDCSLNIDECQMGQAYSTTGLMTVF